MKIVGKSSDRLEFEHRTWQTSLTILGIFLLFAVALVKGSPDMTPRAAVLGTLIVSCIGLLGMALFETSRVAVDRAAGTVSFYRKRALRTQRMTLPLDEFLGVIAVKVTWHEGWNYRVSLVFRIDGRVWLIPASVGTSKTAMRGDVAAINDWHGISTEEVEALASGVYTDKVDPAVKAARAIGQRVRSRQG